MTDVASRRATARRHIGRVWRLFLLAHYIGAAILIIYGYFAIDVYPDRRGAFRVVAEGLVVMIPLLVVASLIGWWHLRRVAMPAFAWMAEGRPATDAERDQLASLARRLAMIGSIYWLSGGGVLLAYLVVGVRYQPGVDGTIRAALAVVLVGIIPWALSFLFVEVALRPVFTEAFAGASVLPRTMGIPARLLLAWVGTSGLPIAGILMVLVAQDADNRARAIPAVFVVCIAGTIAGIAVAIFSGRAIIEPLGRVQRALRDVEEGKFDVQIPVSESAELGELLVGVNRMAAGLRERERMRDVFGRHVGAEVAARAMETEFGAGGDRCRATVMFVDIIGSTGLTQRRDPGAVVAILNRFFDAVVQAVANEGGFVNKFQGDGALCLFGTPLPYDDHAARALRAARNLSSALAPLGDIAAAIGVSSGEVVAGYVGTADRHEFTVIGDAVNEAARLTEEAKLRRSHVLVSERTILEAGAENDGWSRSETLQLRGRTDPTPTYEPATSAS